MDYTLSRKIQELLDPFNDWSQFDSKLYGLDERLKTDTPEETSDNTSSPNIPNIEEEKECDDTCACGKTCSHPNPLMVRKLREYKFIVASRPFSTEEV